jgi:UDP-GlcNAc:undecaprenyl-phosphate GlcNAc-1-phosphate transferase
MLLGLLLAYGPISSAASLDQSLLVNYSQGAHPVNRFPTILPLLIPVAIWIIPYTDMLLAVVRRTMKGMSPFDADRQHLHHRLLNMGHSHRSSVLLMYLWASLFAALVVGLSAVRINLIWFAVITVAAIAALLLATAPKLRPWHGGGKRGRTRGSRDRSDDLLSATPDLAAPAAGAATGALAVRYARAPVEQGPPPGQNGQPAAHNGQPAAHNGQSAGRNGQPAGHNGQSAGHNGQLTGPDGQPAGQNGYAAGQNGYPGGLNGRNGGRHSGGQPRPSAADLAGQGGPGRQSPQSRPPRG